MYETNEPMFLTPDSHEQAPLLVELQTTPPVSSYVHYNGSSMYPTLKEPEFLITGEIPVEKLTPGDIIVFKASHSTIPIVHRIIRVRDGRFITRGDNSPAPDPHPVTADSIIGLAYGVLTHSGIRRIRNGHAGLLICRVYRVWKSMKLHFLKPLLMNSLPCKFAASITRLFSISPEMAVFLSPEKEYQIRLIWKHRTVGIHEIHSGRTIIRQRYRLVFNRRSLEEKIASVIGSPSFSAVLDKAREESSGSS